MAETLDRKRHKIHYQGMVQGVGFRYTVRRIAARFAVVGYVKNLSDGRVLVVAEGYEQEVQRFLADVRARMAHYISDTQATIGPTTGQFSEFDIRF